MRFTAIVLALLSSAALASAGEPGLSGKPSAAKDGDKVKIGFAVSAPTDVEVAVLGADGKVVCHLAAGVLGGKNPPPEPLKPGLVQEVVWDGKDDFGKQIYGGPLAAAKPSDGAGFKIRVRAGMKPVFDGFAGGSPYVIAPIRGIVVDAAGNLYALDWAYRRGVQSLKVFDRNGNYLRSLMPFPATLKKEDAAFDLIPAPGDYLVPRNFQGAMPNLYPGAPVLKLMGTAADGTLILGDEGFTKIYRIKAGDGAPVGGKFGEVIRKGKGGASPSMALSPDGKVVYSAGFAPPDGRICKISLDKPGELQTFADVTIPAGCPPPSICWTPGDGINNSALRGIAVDAKGNVYVSDYANGKLRKFDPAGKELSSVAVPLIIQAVVDDKSGAVYALSGPPVDSHNFYQFGKSGALVKLAGCEEGAKVLAKMEFQTKGGQGVPFLAVDFSGAKPQVWLANAGPNSGPWRTGLLRVEDGGAEFKVLEDLAERDPLAMIAVDRLTVDPGTDDLYVSNGWEHTFRYAGLTGKYNGAVKAGRLDPIQATDTAISPDGYVYIQSNVGKWCGPYVRLDQNLKSAPLAATGKDSFGWVFGRYGSGYCTKGSCVGWDGRLYSLGMITWCRYYVMTYDRDGKVVNGPRPVTDLLELIKPKDGEQAPHLGLGLTGALVGQISVDCGGVKVDRDGHVYVGLQVFPADHKRPAGFEKDDMYGKLGGSVVKFKPEGGGPSAKVPMKEKRPQTRSLADYEGVVQTYPGFGIFSGGTGGCACRSPRFDLDPYGRLYIPNPVTFDVQVVDNAGNEIARFGHYGNFDSQWVAEDSKGQSKGKPALSSPDIPLGWPLSAGVSEKKIYVGDLLNRRVVRVDKKYAAEETCEVKAQ